VTPQAPPSFQPWVFLKQKRIGDQQQAEPCLTCEPLGVPGFVIKNPYPIQIIQTGKQLIMLSELDATYRTIWIDGRPHPKDPDPKFNGDAVGHYERDELVIDTIGLNDKTFVDNYRTPHTDKIHVVERFKLIEGGKILQDTITVDDPGAFNMPWTAVQRWRRTDREMEESICAENNDNFFNYDVVPIPQAGKADF